MSPGTGPEVRRTACKDCPPESKRRAPHPGPRCYTHHKATLKARKAARHGQRVQTTYGISAADYAALHAFQGGRCFICRRATGERRNLAVDHDHAQALRDGHDPVQGCPNCVRGLLCKSCNVMLGRMRDDHAAFLRAASYLSFPPYRAWKLSGAPTASAQAGTRTGAAG